MTTTTTTPAKMYAKVIWSHDDKCNNDFDHDVAVIDFGMKMMMDQNYN